MATLQRDSLGPDVEALQRKLNELGAAPQLEVDGVFGPLTEAAVVAFQATHDLETDGIVGPLTHAALFGDEQPQHPVIPTDLEGRIRQVMDLLVNTHGFPENGAAGIVGNLQAESAVQPNRVEGSASATPMRARNFAGVITDFTAAQIMNRNRAAGVGPQFPGIGLAQWTSLARRAGLFLHAFQGAQLGADILFHMEAQVDYLAHELEASFPHINTFLRQAASASTTRATKSRTASRCRGSCSTAMAGCSRAAMHTFGRYSACAATRQSGAERIPRRTGLTTGTRVTH